MSIYYEWDIETLDEHGDVDDHDFDERLGKLLARTDLPLGERQHLVLVRNVGNTIDGITDRSWAYVMADGPIGALPLCFDCGAQVPRRFHDELRREEAKL